jgi:hypothetical protein
MAPSNAAALAFDRALMIAVGSLGWERLCP